MSNIGCIFSKLFRKYIPRYFSMTNKSKWQMLWYRCNYSCQIVQCKWTMAPFRAKINPDHFGADINILFIITYLSYYFRGGAKKQPVPWPGGPGYNGAYVNILKFLGFDCISIYTKCVCIVGITEKKGLHKHNMCLDIMASIWKRTY